VAFPAQCDASYVSSASLLAALVDWFRSALALRFEYPMTGRDELRGSWQILRISWRSFGRWVAMTEAEIGCPAERTITAQQNATAVHRIAVRLLIFLSQQSGPLSAICVGRGLLEERENCSCK
jgi:hypothetical protein